MRIAVVVGGYHPGNTSDYVVPAFESLGHSAARITREELYSALVSSSSSFDLFFCVDSGETINLLHPSLTKCDFHRVGYWFIDYRHNKDRPERTPNDALTASFLSDRGGWIFQSQWEDVEDCTRRGIKNVSWLPLAADPEVWNDHPHSAKKFHVGFAGNVWDETRANVLSTLCRIPSLKVGFGGPGKLWKTEASQLLRESLVGFNISTFYGSSVAYDVNMRVFETLSSGVPLFTNYVPSLLKIFPPSAPFIWTYNSLESLLPELERALSNSTFLNSGNEGRSFILAHGTYVHRMQTVLTTFFP